MVKGRNNAWTEEQDLRLLHIIFHYEQTNLGRKNAFEAASRELDRTSTACAYRFRTKLREKYTQLLSSHEEKETILLLPSPKETNISAITLDDIAAYISSLQQYEVNQHDIENEHEQLLQENEQLRETYDELHHRYINRKQAIQKLKKELSTLLQVVYQYKEKDLPSLSATQN